MSSELSRRRLMQASAGALLSAGLWPGALRAQDATSDAFTFLAVNDLHYTDENCVPFFQNMLATMKTAAPDAKLLLIVGDLCENGTPAQLAGIRDLLKASGFECRSVIGNHDWQSQTDRAAWDQHVPDSLNYTFDFGGCQFVALDTSDGVKYQQVAALPPTLEWLDRNLPRLDKRRPMLLFTHFPLGVDVKYRLTNADALLDRFKEYNLRAVLNGHFHGFTERTVGQAIITTNRCCSFRKENHDGTKEEGFFVCTARDGKLEKKFIEVKKS